MRKIPKCFAQNQKSFRPNQNKKVKDGNFKPWKLLPFEYNDFCLLRVIKSLNCKHKIKRCDKKIKIK